VFATNDMMAVGCLAAFKDAGVRVPEDIALAGFDDIPIARYVTPALSTVRVRIADFGRLALERLVQVVEHPGQESPSADTLGFEIVVRDTCGGTKPEQNS
jgi:LacI family transcriptional regulator